MVNIKEHDKEVQKKIIDIIEQELSDNPYLYFEIRKSTSEHCSGMEYEWFNYVRFRDFVNKILKGEIAEDD